MSDLTPRTLLAALLCLGATPTLASPVFDGSAADTWVHAAGSAPQALRLGERTIRAAAAGAMVNVFTAGDRRIALAVDPATTQVWVNLTAQSWQPLAADAPRVALVGLDGGVFAEPGALRADVVPAPGEYAGAVRVTLTARGGGRPQIIYTRDGQNHRSDGPSVDVDLLTNGEHALTWWAEEDGRRSAVTQGTWTIGGDPHRDTDGDGIPDMVEAVIGGDAFGGPGASFGRDQSALNDWLRRRRAGDDTDEDGDGWTRFDERIRGTDPRDGDHHPVARGLYGVEARVRVTVRGGLERVDLRVFDARWRPVQPRAADGGPIDPLDSLAIAAVPQLRVPIDTPVVIRATEDQAAHKVWLGSSASVSPADLQGEFADADAWADAFEALLAERLVIDRQVPVDPATTGAVLLMEALLDQSRPTPGDLLVAGDDALGMSPGAFDRLQVEHGAAGDVLLALIELARDAPIADLLDAVAEIDDPGVYRAIDHQQAEIIQRGDLGFAMRVAGAVGLDAFRALAVDARLALVEPDGDVDRDGVTNADEVAAGTDPTRVDSDGDGALDNEDPCGADATNACANAAVDGDRDGVIDPLDNCLPRRNPDQADRDGDGIGDVCEEAFTAVIVAPRLDPVLVTGQVLQVRGAFTDQGPAQVSWDFDGLAPASRDLDPGPITLLEPGVYRVRLTANGATDQRTVTVLGPNRTPLEVRVQVPPLVFEGQRARLTAEANADLVAWDWTLGDGARADTETVRHVYASDGIYAGRLTAVDASDRAGEADFVVTVRDTAPVPDFSVGAPGGLTRVFTDRSAAYDGVAVVRWDFGDGTRAEGAIVEHTYDQAGEYAVRVAVEDGDGSVVETERIVPVLDACDDADADGVCDADDLCADVANATQLDADQDGVGDLCGPTDCAVVARACDAAVAAGQADAAVCGDVACMADGLCAAAADAELARCDVDSTARYQRCRAACADGGCVEGCRARRAFEHDACEAARADHRAACEADARCDSGCVDALRDCLDAAADANARQACRLADAACAVGCVDVSPAVPPVVCDTDADGDGICDAVDNCVDVFNPTQADLDGDGRGDGCTATCDADEYGCAAQATADAHACKARRVVCQQGCDDAACRADCVALEAACDRNAGAARGACIDALDCTPRVLCRAAAEVERALCSVTDGVDCGDVRAALFGVCDAGGVCADACHEIRTACTQGANADRLTCRVACAEERCQQACDAAHTEQIALCFAATLDCAAGCP